MMIPLKKYFVVISSGLFFLVCALPVYAQDETPVAAGQEAVSGESVTAGDEGFAAEAQTSAPTEEKVKLYLKDGSVVEGILVEEKNDRYYVRWQGNLVVDFSKPEILFVERESDTRTLPQVIVYLTNGSSVEGKLIREEKDAYIVEWEGVVTTFTRKEVDHLEEKGAPAVPEEDQQEELPRIMITLVMQDGESYQGELISRTDDVYVINYGGEVCTFYIDEVKDAFFSNAKITTKEGTTYVGKVVDKKDGVYIIEVGDEKIECPDEDIQSIEVDQPRGGMAEITLHLKSGGVIQGELIRREADAYVIKWEGVETRVQDYEIVRAEEHLAQTMPGEADRGRQQKQITLFLVNGGAISGELLRKTDTGYQIKWQGGVTEFAFDEVDHVAEGVALDKDADIAMPEFEEEAWPYENDIVLKLTNGTVLDAVIHDVKDGVVYVRQMFDEGGFLEQEIARSQIEFLLFKPVENEETKKRETELRELFPSMQFYSEGNCTIITDSYVTWIKKYKRIIRQVQTNVYLTFFPLFEGHTQEIQHCIVLFDDPEKYLEYALSDGVPGWIAPGYFYSKDHVLYLYNMVGDRMQEFVRDLMKNVYGGAVDAAVDAVESVVDDRYHVFIEGQAKGIKDKYWKYFDWYMAELKYTTYAVLRHEFTHEIFSNWHIVNVVVSQIADQDLSNIKGKKKLLAASDVGEKRRILMNLMQQKDDKNDVEVKAANSWLSEGLATYAETESLGEVNPYRLFEYQKMMRENMFFPFSQLTVYKIGSFPGVYPDAMISAYAESWALVKFLMEKYPNEFMTYINRVSHKEPKDNEDIEWLIEAVGKPERALEEEFKTYMAQFPEETDPYQELLDKQIELHDSLVHFQDVQ